MGCRWNFLGCAHDPLAQILRPLRGVVACRVRRVGVGPIPCASDWQTDGTVVHGHPLARLAWLNRVELPMPVWYGLRIVSIGTALGLVVVLFVRPEVGLFFFWRVMIPMVPLLFFVAPGLWRNICPMAALNQTPRLFDFTKG